MNQKKLIAVTNDVLTKDVSKLVTKITLDEKDEETKPIIVIDPGHGIKGGNVGTQARIYKYKLMGKDGKELLDKNGKVLTDKKNVNELPQYVLDNPNKWILGNNSSANHELDNERTEYKLTYDVGKIIYDYFKEKKYEVIITRTSRDIKSYDGNDLIRRVNMANEAKADYFISIHADGDNSFVHGAHAIYSSSDGKELASDIMKYYTVVGVLNTSPKKDVRNLYIFKAANKTKRITLVELGFITNPKEAKKLFNNIKLIANQLIKGLEENINRNF